jgi:iron complex transport system substrate-binding protein
MKGTIMQSLTRFRARSIAWIVRLTLFPLVLVQAQVRVVSLSPTPTEIVYALGAGHQLVGATSVCIEPPEVLRDIAEGRVRIVSNFSVTDFALIDSLKPDIILTDTDFQRKITADLRAKGYKVLHYVPRSLEEVLRSIEEIGEAIGRGPFARQLTAQYRAEIDSIKVKSRPLTKVRVYLEINHIGPWAVGTKSPLNDIIVAAGGESVFADSACGVFKATNEEIVRRNPDVILSPIWLHAKLGRYDGITPLAEIYSRKGYDSTAAVQRSRVLYYDSALLKHEGPRQVLAIRKLAHILHPDVFPDPPGTIPWELGWIR